MKTLAFIVIISVLTSVSASAQMDTIWTKTYGGLFADGGKSICETGDGGFIIVGYTFSYGSGNPNVYLIKTDSVGNIQWEKIIGDTCSAYGLSVCQAQDGGYAITGFITCLKAGSEDVYLVKTDPNGNVQWSQTYGGAESDQGRSICQLTDGGYMICGYSQSTGQGEEDVLIVRTDSLGELVLFQTLGGTRSDIGEAIRVTGSGNLIMTGATGSPTITTINSDFYVSNFLSDGSFLWSKAYGTSGTLAYDWGTDLCETNDNGLLTIGNSNTVSPMEMYVVKANSSGTKIWGKNYGGEFYQYGNSVCKTDDGGFFLCGVTKTFATYSNDIYIVRIDTDGNKLWEKQFGGTKNEWGTTMIRTRDCRYVVLGQTDSYGNGSTDVYLMKLGTLEPQFHGEPTLGVIPFNVKFYDQSIGNPSSWQWDLDNDGEVESSEQNPVFTYYQEGTYSITLTVSNGFETKTITREHYIRAINGVEVQYQNEWNLISLPVIPDTTLLFPSSWGYTGSYHQEVSLEFGRGYWAKPPSYFLFSGTPVAADTFDVLMRWNMIGTISIPIAVENISSIPPGIVTSNFYSYIDGGYAAVDTLEPGKGYWVRSSQDGELIISASATPPGDRIIKSSTESLPPPPPNLDEQAVNTIPRDFILKQNFPNPFNPSTVIRYELPAVVRVRLTVHDLLGRQISVLADNIQNPGSKSAEWDAQGYPSGIYLYKLTAVDIADASHLFSQIGKMILMK